MSLRKVIPTLMILLLGIALSVPAFAHGHRYHRHGRIGVFIGAPIVWGWHYPSPYYYPPVVTVPSSPPVYIERADESKSIHPEAGYWYYCRNPEGYYPYVKRCPDGWQQVPAEPPAN